MTVLSLTCMSFQYVPAKPDPKSAKSSGPKKSTTTEYEVLNPGAVEAATKNEPAEDGDDIPEMTEEMLAFSKLSLNGYQQSFEMLQKHPDIYTPGASDALLIAAFNAENDGKHNYAKRCVHQSLLLQYCEKLGTDGVRVFFKR